MSDTRTVAVKLRADTTSYTSSMKGAAASTAKFDAAQAKAQQRADKWRAIGMAGQVGGVAMAAGLLAATKAASNQEQALGALTAVFKANGAAMTANARQATQIGLSTTDYANAAAKLGAQLSNLGVDQTQLGATTDDLIKKAADLAAQSGGTTLEAVDALGAAMRGEADPAERYGLALQVTAVNAEMAATGTDKATAMMSLLNKQMTKTSTVGAWNREIETSAAQMQMARAEFEDASAALGTALLPAMAKVGKAAAAMLDWFNQLPEPLKAATTYIGAFVAATLMIAPRVGDSVSAINDLRKALMEAGEEAVTTKGKLANVATSVGKGGALVLGLAAVTMAVEGMNDSVSEATGINNRWLQALTNVMQGGVTPMQLPVSALSEAVRQLGISMGMIPEDFGMTGASPELEQFAQRVRNGEGSIRVFAEAVNAGVAPAEAFARAQQAVGFAAGRAAGGIGDSATATGADIEAKERQTEALAKATENYEAYIAAVQQALGLLSARDALIGQEDRLAEAVKKNGNALKGRTEAAAANRAAMAAEIGNISNLIDSTYKSTAAKHNEARALQQAEKVRQEQVAALKRSAAAAGYDRDQVRALIKQMGLVKPVVSTDFQTPGLAAALRNVKGLGGALGALAGSISIPVTQRRAAGGYVTGPGTGTSDDIPANLSNGEYVLRASAVRRIGVDELDRMNYAKGGRVKRGPSGGGRTSGGGRRGGGGGGRAGRPERDTGDMGFGKAMRAVDKWAEKVAESKAKLKDLKREAADYATSISQNILAGAGGGLFDMFKKSDMDAASKSLADAQDRVSAASKRLYDAQVKVNTASPEERADALRELADAQRELGEATGEQAKAEAAAAAAAPTPENIMGRMRGRAEAIENYASKVKALLGRGLSIDMIKELAGADMMEAGPVLDALLAMPADALAELGSLDKRAKDAAASVGSAVSGAVFAPQIGAAEMELGVNQDGLEDALGDADKTIDKEWRKKLAKMGLSVEERVQMMQSIRANDGKLTKHWRNVLAKAGLSAEERAELMEALGGADTTMGREWRNKLQTTGLSAEERQDLYAALAGGDVTLSGQWRNKLARAGLGAEERADLLQSIGENDGKLTREWRNKLARAGLGAEERADLLAAITGGDLRLSTEWRNKLARAGLGAEERQDLADSLAANDGKLTVEWRNKLARAGLGAEERAELVAGMNAAGIKVDENWTSKKKDIGLGASGKGNIETDIGGDNDQSDSPHGKVNKQWRDKKKDIGLGASGKNQIETDIGVDGAKDDGPMGKVNKNWTDKTKYMGLGVSAKATLTDDAESIGKKAGRAFKSGLGGSLGSAAGAFLAAAAKFANGKATGGMIVGPGTGTSDTAGLFALSNGEYVVRAASVAKYGQSMLDAINAGRFASGGPVGYRTTTAAPGGMSGGAVVTSVPVIVQIDGREIAKSQLKIERQSGGTITVGG